MLSGTFENQRVRFFQTRVAPRALKISKNIAQLLLQRLLFIEIKRAYFTRFKSLDYNDAFFIRSNFRCSFCLGSMDKTFSKRANISWDIAIPSTIYNLFPVKFHKNPRLVRADIVISTIRSSTRWLLASGKLKEKKGGKEKLDTITAKVLGTRDRRFFWRDARANERNKRVRMQLRVLRTRMILARGFSTSNKHYATTRKLKLNKFLPLRAPETEILPENIARGYFTFSLSLSLSLSPSAFRALLARVTEYFVVYPDAKRTKESRGNFRACPWLFVRLRMCKARFSTWTVILLKKNIYMYYIHIFNFQRTRQYDVSWLLNSPCVFVRINVSAAYFDDPARGRNFQLQLRMLEKLAILTLYRLAITFLWKWRRMRMGNWSKFVTLF